MAKALRKKCRKYVLYGDMRGLFPKMLDIAVRFMENVENMECEECGKFVRFNKKEVGTERNEGIEDMPRVEYPVLNHGVKFYHMNCCPDGIKSKIF